jgi:hypothetical protein
MFNAVTLKVSIDDVVDLFVVIGIKYKSMGS